MYIKVRVSSYLVPATTSLAFGAHSSAWIEWLPAEQLVEGSNPSGPKSILSLYSGPRAYTKQGKVARNIAIDCKNFYTWQ